MKRLGITVDWDKYRFTPDDKYHQGVIKAFVELYRKDKIYWVIVSNWDQLKLLFLILRLSDKKKMV